MKTKLITYTLNNPNDYSILKEHITSYPNWAKIMPRVWIINTDESSVQIRRNVSSSVNNRGKFFVVDVTGRAWGSYGLEPDINEWIKTNL